MASVLSRTFGSTLLFKTQSQSFSMTMSTILCVRKLTIYTCSSNAGVKMMKEANSFKDSMPPSSLRVLFLIVRVGGNIL